MMITSHCLHCISLHCIFNIVSFFYIVFISEWNVHLGGPRDAKNGLLMKGDIGTNSVDPDIYATRICHIILLRYHILFTMPDLN